MFHLLLWLSYWKALESVFRIKILDKISTGEGNLDYSCVFVSSCVHWSTNLSLLGSHSSIWKDPNLLTWKLYPRFKDLVYHPEWIKQNDLVFLKKPSHIPLSAHLTIITADWERGLGPVSTLHIWTHLILSQSCQVGFIVSHFLQMMGLRQRGVPKLTWGHIVRME